MATIIIIISIFFHHTRKTSFLSAGKKRTKVPELGGGGLNLHFLLMSSLNLIYNIIAEGLLSVGAFLLKKRALGFKLKFNIVGG